MKILTVCQYYHPETFQISPICEALAAAGNKVTVLTGLPNYPTGIIPDEYLHGRKRDELINGVHVIRVNERARKKGAVNLALNYLSFLVSAMRRVKKLPGDFDIVFSYQLSPVLMALPAKWYAKKRGRPLFVYCLDLWPESLKLYIKNENDPIFLWIKKISRGIYEAADVLAVHSKSFFDYMEKVHGIKRDKIRYLPAFAAEEYLDSDLSPEDNDCFDIVFMGNTGIAQDLDNVLDAFELAADEGPMMKLHIVGDGSRLDDLKKRVSTDHLTDRVIFHGRHPVKDMPGFYRLADACLVSLKEDNATGLTLPAKLQGYMAAGKPVLGMLNGSAREVIDGSGCGICVPASDAKALCGAILKMASEKEKLREYGDKGREYFKANFRKEIFMEKIISIFNDMYKDN